MAASHGGICSLEFDDDFIALNKLSAIYPKSKISPACQSDLKDFNLYFSDLEMFLQKKKKDLHLPLAPQGSAFQKKVWNALTNIPPGKTACYSQIAKLINKPNAARAVAKACASNKIAIAIPCHRIIRQSGELGGYRWGVERKKILLAKKL